MIRDESGQTLVELMIATVIGLIVVFAAFLMLENSMRQNTNISMREEATQKGRLAMELITRELRSQVCIGSATPAIVPGSNDTSITFTDDLSGNVNPPMKRTLTYVPAPTGSPANTPGKITETRIQGAGFPPNTTFNGPATTVTVVTNVLPIQSVPVFQYYQFDTTTGGVGLFPTPMAIPLDAVRAAQAVDVKVSFRIFGSGKANANVDQRLASSFQNDVYTRVANPSTPKLGTNCS
jgi:type II secretory pathway pseudopilin PulG